MPGCWKMNVQDVSLCCSLAGAGPVEPAVTGKTEEDQGRDNEWRGKQEAWFEGSKLGSLHCLEAQPAGCAGCGAGPLTARQQLPGWLPC